MNNPSLVEIKVAMALAKELGTQAAARDLQRIRGRKTTWIGSLENSTRIEVDVYLRKILSNDKQPVQAH